MLRQSPDSCGIRPIALLALCTACNQPEEVDKPRAPNLNALVQDYESPSASFEGNEEEVLRQFGDRATQLLSTGLIEQTLDALETTLSEAETDSTTASRAQKRAPSRRLSAFEGDGYARATRICAGWGERPEPNRAQNGFMELTLGFTEGGLDPVVWGTLKDCRYRLDETRVLLTELDSNAPALAMHLGTATESEEIANNALLFDVHLAGAVDDSELTLELDFRLLPESGELEFLVPAGDGQLVVVTRSAIPVGFRAKNGRFECGTDLDCSFASRDAGTPAAP